MRLRTVGLVLAFAVLIAPLHPGAQPAVKPRRIGWLGLAAPTPSVQRILGEWRQALHELGWADGKNLTIEERWAHGRAERLTDLAADLIRLNVELIVANCGPQIAAIRRASSTVPIVVSTCGDPVGMGFTTSFARPGGNLTGMAMQDVELSAKRLELLKELQPNVARLALLVHAGYQPFLGPIATSIEAAAKVLGIRLLDPLLVGSPDEFSSAFATMAQQRADALMVLADPFTYLHRARLVELAGGQRLPVIFAVKEYLDVGGLFSYGPSILVMFRRSATFVDKILRGAKADDLPIEQPTKFELVISLKTAKALGLTIPPSLLLRADKVIE